MEVTQKLQVHQALDEMVSLKHIESFSKLLVRHFSVLVSVLSNEIKLLLVDGECWVTLNNCLSGGGGCIVSLLGSGGLGA